MKTRLTEADVHAAIESMLELGEKPTALNLLKALGRGSLSTISKYLSSFGNLQDGGRQEINLPAVIDMPSELKLTTEALAQKVWSSARALANHEIEGQLAALRHAESEADAKVEEALEFSETQAKQIEDLENLLDELRLMVTEKDANIKELEADVKNLTQALNQEVKDKELAQHEIESLKTSLAKTEKMADETKAELVACKSDCQDARELVANLKGQLEVYTRRPKATVPGKSATPGKRGPKPKEKPAVVTG